MAKVKRSSPKRGNKKSKSRSPARVKAVLLRVSKSPKKSKSPKRSKRSKSPKRTKRSKSRSPHKGTKKSFFSWF